MQFLHDYITGPTHKWWVDNVWKPSWTRLVTWIYGLPALLVSVWEVFARFANDTTINEYMTKLEVPNWVPMTLTLIALVHYVAAGRD